jgi:hypothetical protein
MNVFKIGQEQQKGLIEEIGRQEDVKGMARLIVLRRKTQCKGVTMKITTTKVGLLFVMSLWCVKRQALGDRKG